MPDTKFDAKSFNPEAFRYMVGRVPNLKMNEIKKSSALAANPDIRAVFGTQNGTSYARIAMRGLLDGEAVNYDGQTDITATGTKTFERGVVVVGHAKAWREKDFSYDITGGVDFMQNIADNVPAVPDGLINIVVDMCVGDYSHEVEVTAKSDSKKHKKGGSLQKESESVREKGRNIKMGLDFPKGQWFRWAENKWCSIIC